MHLIGTSKDCKQRSSTVSKKAPTVSKEASPGFNRRLPIGPSRITQAIPQGFSGVTEVLSCPKVRFKHVCCASDYIFITASMNIQAAEVLTSDASSEHVQSIDVLTSLVSRHHGEKQQSNTNLSKQKKNATENKQQKTKEATKTLIKACAHKERQTNNICADGGGLRTPWSVI